VRWLKYLCAALIQAGIIDRYHRRREQVMELEGKNIAVFVADMFEDLEYWYPVIRMKEAGAEVTSIGPRAESFRGKNGLSASADIGIEEASPEDYSALIIPGGYSPDMMRRSKKMVSFVKKIDSQGAAIAAICHGAWMLASAEILEGRKVTSFFSIRDDIVHAGAEWVDEEVVIDGNIITSRNPGDLPAFCRAIIEALSGS
jgi:protease I